MKISNEAKELLEDAKSIRNESHVSVTEVLQAQLTATLTTIVSAAMADREADKAADKATGSA